MKKLFALLAFALISCSAFAQGIFPTPAPRKTATPTAAPTAAPGPIAVDALPSTYAATNAAAVGKAFREAFFNAFYKDAVALNGWSAPTGTTGFAAIDPNPNTAIVKFVNFLVILRKDGHGLYDLLAERHDSNMAKVAQAFQTSAGNVANAASYTEETQGISSYLAQDTIVATDAAAGIDALAFVQVRFCDVAPDLAYAAYQKVRLQLTAAGITQQAFPCAVPTPTPSPVPTATAAPTATATATPTPSPSLTPTATPPGGFLVTINCAGCAPATYSAPASGVTITISPK